MCTKHGPPEIHSKPMSECFEQTWIQIVSDADFDCNRNDNADDCNRAERDKDHAVQLSVVAHPSFPLSSSPFASFISSLPVSPTSDNDQQQVPSEQEQQPTNNDNDSEQQAHQLTTTNNELEQQYQQQQHWLMQYNQQQHKQQQQSSGEEESRAAGISATATRV